MEPTDAKGSTEQALELLAVALTALHEAASADGFPRGRLATLVKRARLRLVATTDTDDGGVAAGILSCNGLLDEALNLVAKQHELSEPQARALSAIERGQAMLYYVAFRAESGEPKVEPRSLRPRPLVPTSRPPEPAPASAPASAPRRSVAPSEAERRRAHRLQLTTEVSFLGPTNFYLGFLEDISSGGLFLSTYNIQPIGTHVAVSFTFPDGHTVQAGGVVRWVRDVIDPDEDSTPGIGIMFDELGPEDRAAIHEFISLRDPMFYDDE